MFQEFKEFVARGNVVDLAVGVIIGASFKAIVDSLVNQVIMPPVGLVTGGVDFAKLEYVLRAENPATPGIGKVAIQYGAFINTIIQFLIIAFVIFMVVKLVNRMRRTQPATPAAPTTTELLLTEIRDAVRRT